MASEAITQNDLREILSRTVGSVPSEYRKLLWTNPSPTSAFSAQTISLDLSAYDDIEIFFVGGATNNNYAAAEQKFPINSGQLLTMFVSQATGVPRPQRGLTITSTGIVFTAGGWTSGTTYTSNDLYCVPLKIYGIKYERVAPPQVDASDYVIEQDTSGIWTYRKWNSGIAECWGTHTHSVTSWGTWGSLYEGMPVTYATYPTNLFISTPLVMIINATTANGICGIELYNGSPSKDQTPNFHFLRPSTGSALTAYANIYAKGRWK